MNLPNVAKHAFGDQMGPNMQKAMPVGSPPHQGLKSCGLSVLLAKTANGKDRNFVTNKSQILLTGEEKLPCRKLPDTKGSLDIHKKEQGKHQFSGMLGHKNGLLGFMGAL